LIRTCRQLAVPKGNAYGRRGRGLIGSSSVKSSTAGDQDTPAAVIYICMPAERLPDRNWIYNSVGSTDASIRVPIGKKLLLLGFAFACLVPSDDYGCHFRKPAF
jgi:hypothetical protein